MNLNLKELKKELLFLPLGGSGEIGLNCNLYHYNGKWIMVDCGIGFTKEMPGIDITVPDISFVKKHRKDLLGIVLTHIHEDHLGALQYLWEELKVPIYTSNFTAVFLKEKLSRSEFLDRVKIIEVKDGTKINLKSFQLEFVGLTHSTPEMNAVLIKTKKGTILHTGDWKFDYNPVSGRSSNIKRLRELGQNKEVLATVCDSTNIFEEGKSRSESELLKSFKKIISTRKGMVVCATFASNISRVLTLSKAARACGRKVVLVGTSLRRITKVGKATGYLPKDLSFVPDRKIKDFKRSEIFIISTGCQGESKAGLTKMSEGIHPTVKLRKDDTVIFSSKIIPGNEKSIMKVYNRLSDNDVEIVTEKNAFVHVSGHYSREDLKKMYALVKPKVAIGIHGESMHLAEHKRVASQCGIKKIIKAKNGNITLITEKNPRSIGTIPLKNIAVDGKRLLFSDGKILKERTKMSFSGLIVVNFIINKRFKLLAKPAITAPGLYNLKENLVMREILDEDISEAYREAIRELKVLIKKKQRTKDGKLKFSTSTERQNFIEQKVRTTINRITRTDLDKKPVIEVVFSIIK